MYSNLNKFVDQLGHPHVPINDLALASLYSWTGEQRQLRKKGKLALYKIMLLQYLGFVWDEREALWLMHFHALKNYCDRHGHCNITSNCPEDPQLGKWVSRQRELHSLGKLSHEKIQALEQIGFVWKAIYTWDKETPMSRP